jgi:hypothetical protein
MIDYFLSRKEDSEEVDNINNKSKDIKIHTQRTTLLAPRPILIQNPVIQSKEANQMPAKRVESSVKPMIPPINTVIKPLPPSIKLNNNIRPIIPYQNIKPPAPIPRSTPRYSTVLHGNKNI